MQFVGYSRSTITACNLAFPVAIPLIFFSVTIFIDLSLFILSLLFKLLFSLIIRSVSYQAHSAIMNLVCSIRSILHADFPSH